jgi:serine/threonine protein phosphatase PrpC
MHITTASEIGSRSYQEDRFVVVKYNGGALLAVMDGHGGDEVSDYLAKALPAIFNAKRNHLSIRHALLAAFKTLDERTRDKQAGSTLSVVYVSKRKRTAYIATLGDSPVIIKNPNNPVPWISPEHNAGTNEKERKAAVERGAVYLQGYLYYQDGNHGIQLCRALGDRDLGKFLGRTPEIFCIPILRDSFIFLASDGIFDRYHAADSAVVYLTNMIANGADAKALVHDAAVERNTEDNVTVVLCRMK